MSARVAAVGLGGQTSSCGHQVATAAAIAVVGNSIELQEGIVVVVVVLVVVSVVRRRRRTCAATTAAAAARGEVGERVRGG